MRFTELDLDPRLQQAIADRGYTELTPVQELTLAKSLKGQDVAVQSQTGTGKTAAFLITLFPHLLKHSKSCPAQGPHHRPDPRAGRPDRGRGPAPQPAHRAPDRLLLRRRRLHRPAGPDQGRPGHHHRHAGAAARPGREEAAQLQGVRLPRHRRGRPALRHGLPARPPRTSSSRCPSASTARACSSAPR
ncbi:MAG: DEAD/DEAH box helicase [Candidatus Moduliflexus flocculans]|nr:DEAD/DEAH box helicase [Candidatus Moduliflexus flocculans]